jgi:hypothetical protein
MKNTSQPEMVTNACAARRRRRGTPPSTPAWLHAKGRDMPRAIARSEKSAARRAPRRTVSMSYTSVSGTSMSTMAARARGRAPAAQAEEPQRAGGGVQVFGHAPKTARGGVPPKTPSQAALR